MTQEATPAPPIKHYFVDEAGDPTLFDARGRVIAGTEGCSSHFILGVLSAVDPMALNQRVSELHAAGASNGFCRSCSVPTARFKKEKSRGKAALLCK